MKRIPYMALTLLAVSASSLLAQENPDQTKPSTINVSASVRATIPPELVVRVAVTADGATQLGLEPVKYDRPPADGIQEYTLMITPTAGNAGRVARRISTSSRSKTVATDMRWIKGVRVGADGQEVLLNPDDLNRIASFREFQGVSKNGNFDEALQHAIDEMNAAMSESRVADGMATWQLGPVEGRVGGFAGFNELSVVVYAIRTPPWD